VFEAFESGEVVEEEFDGRGRAVSGWPSAVGGGAEDREGVLGGENGGKYCPG